VDGVQYVAFPTGCCSIAGAGLASELTPDILGLRGSAQIWVFRLPQD